MISFQNLHIDRFRNIHIFEYYLKVFTRNVYFGGCLSKCQRAFIVTCICFGGHRKCAIWWVMMAWFQGSERRLLSYMNRWRPIPYFPDADFSTFFPDMSQFSCPSLCHWPVTYLMMLSNWLMSCQAWPPLAHYGQWARCKHGRPAAFFLYKMACFNGVNLNYCQTHSARISMWHTKSCLLYQYNISRCYEKPLCCRWTKLCEFTQNKQGVSQCFHLTSILVWFVYQIIPLQSLL